MACLAGSITRTVKYDESATTDVKYPCFDKATVKFKKNEALLMRASRYREEEGGDWMYWKDDEVFGFGVDADEKWYGCHGDHQAETPSGVKCGQVGSSFTVKEDIDDQCTYDNFKLECDYDTDQKTGEMTVADHEAEMEKNPDPNRPKVVEMQAIFWECEFDSADVGAEVSATCKKPKLVKTKHDGDRAEECFAS